MAVQQNKKSRSRRDMRRSHDGLKLSNKLPTLSVNSLTGETHLRHHLTPDGYDRHGRQIVGSETAQEIAE